MKKFENKHFTTTKLVVVLKNGKFVKSWQYSQGIFDVLKTSDVDKAEEIGEMAFDTFFSNEGATRVRVTKTITLDAI